MCTWAWTAGVDGGQLGGGHHVGGGTAPVQVGHSHGGPAQTATGQGDRRTGNGTGREQTLQTEWSVSRSVSTVQGDVCLRQDSICKYIIQVKI